MSFIFADRLSEVGEYFFSKKLEVVQKMKQSGIDVINLGVGSPDLAPADRVIKKTIETLQLQNSHGYASYRGTIELRQKISNFYKNTFNVKLAPETEVLPLLGSKEGVLYVSMALLNPGDSVLIPNPGYPAYSSVAKLLGVNILYYDLLDASDWLPDFSQIEKLDLSRCKLMWVNYPHMPTGRAPTQKLFNDLVSFGKNNSILICNDNPYSLVLHQDSPLSILNADKNKLTTLELNSLSKSFNMAGWRVGMLAAAQPVVDAVLQVKSNVDSGMFMPIQAGAIEALSMDSQWHLERNKIYQERRSFVVEIFNEIGFKHDDKQIGMFIWAKAPDHISDVVRYCDKILEKAHVFITPGKVFGSNGDRYARIALCASKERLREALDRIKKTGLR